MRAYSKVLRRRTLAPFLPRTVRLLLPIEGFSLWCRTTGTTIDFINSPFDENAEVQTVALAFADSLLEADEPLEELIGDGTSAGLLEVLAFERRLIGPVACRTRHRTV